LLKFLKPELFKEERSEDEDEGEIEGEVDSEQESDDDKKMGGVNKAVDRLRLKSRRIRNKEMKKHLE
jgi:hypothetical protein